MEELAATVDEHEQRVSQMITSYETLQKRYLDLVEARHVLRETAVFFQEAEQRRDESRLSTDEPTAPLLEQDIERGDNDGQPADLSFVAGTIPRSRINTFERILWRALRGNLFMNHAEIEETIIDPTTDERVDKNVFIIFAHGKELLAKIRKIAESMGATLYPVDSSPDLRREMLLTTESRIEDLQSVLQNTNNTRRAELVKISESIQTWMTVVRKEKAIYHTLNKFNYDVNRKTLIAEGWCPTADRPLIQLALRNAQERASSSVSSIMSEIRTTKEPPTYHRTNKFTGGFQAIIDAYGATKYGEVNPGLFTIITFPFLFAVMFGDVGHGFLMTLIAAYLCIQERKLAKIKDEIFQMFFFGRYIILLMGIFSIYTGLIYNDMFSLSLSTWHSGWEWPSNFTAGQNIAAHQVGVYPFGLDPAWHGTENNLLFTNSYKMKMSIIFGVIHMSVAIMFNVFNFIHFDERYRIWAEFVPQFLFMQCLFGYLVICIIYKWTVDWTTSATSPPGLLNMLIYMFLSPGSVDPKEQLYPGQSFIQLLLLLIALVCVPWMLLARPLYLRREAKRITEQGYQGLHNQEDADIRPSAESNGHHFTLGEDDDGNEAAETPGNNHDAATNGPPTLTEEMHEEEHFEFGEVMMHQVIHTIEFCLGCISNTASYLRLWALSLAHAQLSQVLWNMTLALVFEMDGILGAIALVVAFALWFILTLGILLIMEGLSAFLHALRLHWVESNSKHLIGGGYPFQPFSFEGIDDEE